MSTFRIVPAGDSAVLLEFDERIDPAVNARAVAVAQSIEASPVDGVRDVVPTFKSVAIYFDPLRTDVKQLMSRLEIEGTRTRPDTAVDRPPVRIPVCYGGELGPDLEEVAAFAGMHPSGVIAVHTSRTYRVFMLGFLPGFAYLASVDPRIAAPRRDRARVRVAAGSVGIAGAQTGIYPSDTPGGWRLVGRTPVRPYDPDRLSPFLLAPGDRVEFYSIEVDEYARLCGAISPAYG
jgi:inhibitor of KinA